MNDLGHYSVQIVCHLPGASVPETITLMEQPIKEVKSIISLGLRHEEQIELLQKVQDQILTLQSSQVSIDVKDCPKCGRKLQKSGYKKSEFNSVFTDHKISIQHKCCRKCHWSHTPSIRSEFGTSMHPDLAKLQCEIGSKHSYRSAQEILDRQSFNPRRVNNHERIFQVVQSVGDYITKTKSQESTSQTEASAELIVQVDGGHLKDKNPQARSFEAMTAVIYKPENIETSADQTRGRLTSKHCAASSLSDNQAYMFESSLIAAKKQGLDQETWLTALCDGAKNCWSIVDKLSTHCRGTTKILDWFHISMKFETISLPKREQEKFEKAKWHLWRGNVEKALDRLSGVIGLLKNSKLLKRVEKLKGYIENNRKNIVNYEQRKKKGLVFTSHLAESTVESLINQRCKGKQHMTWTRKGVHPLLQIRAFIASNDWNSVCYDKILGAMAH